MTTGDWIFEDNLPCFIRILCEIMNYEISDKDFKIIAKGVYESDEENNVWFNYNLFDLSLSFARTRASCDLLIKIDLKKKEPWVLEKLNLLFHICQGHDVKE